MRFYQDRHKERRRFGREYAFQEMFLRHRHGGSRGGFGERGEGRRRFFERGEFKFALLELLASEPMHGYQLIKAMEDKTGGLYSPSAGSIYPNLQLLDDMKLISYSETDGKKLYHITDEGREALREREEAAKQRTEGRWERHGRYRQLDGRSGKMALRSFIKEKSDLIYLMARAAEAAQANPASEQAAKYHELLAQFQNGLNDILSAAPDSHSASDETVTPLPEENDLTTDDKKDGE
ncbi:PadR family transcriptional regulator [Paenibacillus sp. NPDC056579]|uniref:PadR family transcriptional regulator n=1 Tax=Paenibacillus sp. NPDC056579 TaxID=3345871 RepID=UPI003677A916